jgi:DUF4097 and DUF4098 domain-containing protein YvlB
MPHWDFPATEPIDLLVEVTAGSVRIAAHQTDAVSVDVRSTKSGQLGDEFAEQVRVDFTDGRLEIVEPRQARNWVRFSAGLEVVVALPTGSHCSITSASADVRVAGELGSLNVKTASGAIQADTVTGEVDLNAASGSIRLSDGAGRVTANSASGAIEIGRVGGDLDINNISGKVEIGKAEADANVNTASGRIRIGSLARGQAEIASVSGEIRVQIAKGTGVYLDVSSLSGKVTSQLDASEASEHVDLHLQCRSISGSIKVARADLADVA